VINFLETDAQEFFMGSHVEFYAKMPENIIRSFKQKVRFQDTEVELKIKLVKM
jgi:hypothetical protein